MEPTRETVDEVQAEMAGGKQIVFLDTRSPEAWDSSDVKIPNAIRVPPTEVDQHLAEIPRDREIITYCT